MRDFLESWVIESIKPINISCERPIILGDIAYTTDELIIGFLPTVVAIGIMHEYFLRLSKQND